MKSTRPNSRKPESTLHPVILELAELLGIMLAAESQCATAADNQGDHDPSRQARGDLRPL